MTGMLEAKPKPLEIDPQRTTVIIIDMQNACVSNGGMFNLFGLDVSNSQKTFGPINSLTIASRAKGRKVVYIVHQYSPDFREIGDPDSVLWVRTGTVVSYNQHPEWREKLLIRGTWGAEIVDDLEPKEGDIVVEKSRYSAFWGTNLDVILKTLGTRYLVIGGVMTNICVEATLRDAFYYGYFPILISDAVAASSTEMQDATITNVINGYGWVTTSQNLIEAMK
jgi:ureidoacrylate peracid hydrolase